MRVISLFSGAGGLDLGMKNAGHTILWANDIDSDAVDTYRHNIGDEIRLEDIALIDPEEIPEGDVVIGGFPCQGYSVANLRRSPEDSRNQLYLSFIKVVRAKKPYKVNMADYGIPQSRQRVFIIGQRTDVSDRFLFHFPEPEYGKSTGKPWRSIRSAIDHFPNPDQPNNVPNHVYSAYAVKYRNFTAHRQTDPEKPSPTILARGNGKGGVCAIPHYNGTRRLTVRESAAIQTFPDNFVFYGSMTSCYRQVGNAVPPIFAQLLGKELKRIEVEEL